MVFGSQLRIQVPSGRAVELVSSPMEFGFNNRDMQLAVLSPARRFLPRYMQVYKSDRSGKTGGLRFRYTNCIQI